VRIMSISLLWTACQTAPNEPPTTADFLIPKPGMVVRQDGQFTLTAQEAIAAEGEEALRIAEALAEDLRPATGLPLPVSESSSGTILFRIDQTAPIPPEGYTLDIDRDGVRLVAADATGLFWATQTLKQLLPPFVLRSEPAQGRWTLPFVHIEDEPRFAWRGYMIDVARHFFTVDEVKRQIDALALHKLNRLHLHLTDDQGWRIDIPSWPDLALIGGETEVGGGPGGFYTQAEYSDIVAYAAERHITVIPEIDFPGHSHAARASYPELNPDGVALTPYTGSNVLSTALWLDGPDTDAFVKDVWKEVIALTPGDWVHIGADEAFDVEPEAYDAFVTELAAFIREQGKVPIGWDEIGEASMTPPFVAQHWVDLERAKKSVEQGALLIASPAEHAYLDMIHDERAEYGQVWVGAVNVERAYTWEPAPPGIAEDHMFGVEGALWTELIADEAQVDFMTWPRLAALAEVGWTSPESRSWDDFSRRLVVHGERLEALGLGFYRSPEVTW
jgi:hexosaminidase